MKRARKRKAARKARTCWVWWHKRSGSVCDASTFIDKKPRCMAKLPLVRTLVREVLQRRKGAR